ncbi:hypothetical protein KEM54_003420 [Ascosphaera aggregata]|nr:hypothetical protein KEM54_003420 [Ascosphaera aggregata]
MRFVAKFYVVAFLTTCALIYFAYQLIDRQPLPRPSQQQHPSPTEPTTTFGSLGSVDASQESHESQDSSGEKIDRNDFRNRLVIFGDSSSDDSIFPSPSKGRVWTDLLCSQYDCVRERYSQASTSSIAFVDSHDLELLDQKYILPAPPLPDFSAQMDLFLKNERENVKHLTKRAIGERRQNTIFVVQFGLWDTWRLLGRSENEVKDSVSRTIDTIFKQLSRLVDEFDTTDVRIILMGGIDVTFLPAYTAADGHRQAIEVSEKWNEELRKRAENFRKCSIFLVDVQAFLVDQFRLRELWSNGYIENDEYAKDGRIPWLNVRDACSDESARRLFFLSGSTCRDPERYLFW